MGCRASLLGPARRRLVRRRLCDWLGLALTGTDDGVIGHDQHPHHLSDRISLDKSRLGTTPEKRNLIPKRPHRVLKTLWGSKNSFYGLGQMR